MMNCASKMSMGMMKMAREASKSSPACGPAGATVAGDLVDTLRELGSFKTLRTAMDAAGLTDALGAKGPYTLFAPTDEAFAKLPAGTVDGLLKDIPKLKGILSRHVVAGLWRPEEWMETIAVKTLQGQSIRITVGPERITVEDNLVTVANIKASNGVIHAIGAVLLPK